jgi:hypothetical protein
VSMNLNPLAFEMDRRHFLRGAVSTLALAALPLDAAAQSEPLPNWRDGGTKRTVLRFVAEVTREGAPRYVAPEDRIAVFDNDGTLWCERPTVEAVYMMEKVRALINKRPELAKQEPYSTLIAGGMEGLATLPPAAVIRVFSETHTGMTDDEFVADVQRFLSTANHPKYGVPLLQAGYVPQLELLSFLRANGFGVWLCSGGEVSFVRVAAARAYGLAPQNVIGTSFRFRAEEQDGRLGLRRTGQLLSFNDKEDKPANIHQHIGKRPIIAVGNEGAGGDIAMLRYTREGPLPSLALLVNHDDAKREYAYSEKDGASLHAAQKYGFSVISMKNDWRRVFSFDA